MRNALISLWLLLLAASPALCEPTRPAFSATGYYLEQFYLNPKPDLTLLHDPPESGLRLLEDEFWHYPPDVLDQLIRRHPGLPARLEAGAAFRKKVFDRLKEKISQTYKANGIPQFVMEGMLQSYNAALAAHRKAEEKRSRVEAETMAYEKTRTERGYAPGTSVGSWRLPDQRKHTALVERFRDEKTFRPRADDVLPPEKFREWKAAMILQLEGHWDTKKDFLSALEESSQKLPEGYLVDEGIDRMFYLHRGVLHLNDPDDAQTQRRLIRGFQSLIPLEHEDQENVWRRRIGFGDYRQNEYDTTSMKEFSWIRDLEWASLEERARGDAVEIARYASALESVAIRRERSRELKRSNPDQAERLDDILIAPSHSQLYRGVSESHVAMNFPVEKGRGSDPVLFEGSYPTEGRLEQGLPRGAPLEFIVGDHADWDPVTAKRYSPDSRAAHFYLESTAHYLPSQGLIAIPRPEGHHANVQLFRGDTELPKTDFRVLETPEGLLFAQVLSGSPIRLRIGYRKGSDTALNFSRKVADVPVLTTGEREALRMVGAELTRMGERHVSEALLELVADKAPIHVSDIAAVIQERTLYSYFPATRAEQGDPGLGSFRPFLDPKGTLCLQCSGAADLLDLILRRTLLEHPDWRTSTGHVLVRESGSRKLTEESGHRWVTLRRGRTQVVLDPTPYRFDPRVKRPADENISTRLRTPAFGRSDPHPPPGAAARSFRFRGPFAARPDAIAGADPRERSHGENSGIRLLGNGWEAPFISLRDLAAAAVEKLKSTFAHRARAKEASPTEVSAPPLPVEPFRSLQVPEGFTGVIKHPEARLAQSSLSDRTRDAVRAELAARKERNEKRRQDLRGMGSLERVLHGQLESLRGRPLQPTLALPHQVAGEALRHVREFVEGRSALTAQKLSDELSRAKQTIKSEQDFFGNPARAFPRDRVREVYLAEPIALPAARLVDALNEVAWSPLESEDIDDIIEALKPKKLCDAVNGAL